jgi:hypothetical protein
VKDSFLKTDRILLAKRMLRMQSKLFLTFGFPFLILILLVTALSLLLHTLTPLGVPPRSDLSKIKKGANAPFC